MSESCGLCGSNTLDFRDGFTFCLTCGNQTQGIVVDDDAFFGEQVRTAAIGNSVRAANRLQNKQYEQSLQSITQSSQQLIQLSQTLGIDVATNDLTETLVQSLKTEDMRKLEEKKETILNVREKGRENEYEESAIARITLFSQLLNNFTNECVEKLRLSQKVKGISLKIWLKYLSKNGIVNKVNEFPAERNMFLDITRRIFGIRRPKSLLDDFGQEIYEIRCTQFLNRLKICTDGGSLHDLNLADKCNAVCLTSTICVCIVYLAIVSAGERSILLSDLLRWIRCGIVKVDHAGFECIQARRTRAKSNPWTKPYSDKSGNQGINWKPENLERVEYVFGGLIVLLDFVDLPLEPVAFDLARITLRFIYNLNLPKCMMNRVNYLYEMCPPRSQLLHANECWISLKNEHENAIYWANNVTHVYSWYKQKAIRQPLECEIMQYLMLALVLTFGLDDKNEKVLSEAARNSQIDNSFDIREWLLQLKMRVTVLLGESKTKVLRKDWVCFMDNPWSVLPFARIPKSRQDTLVQYANSPLPLQFTTVNPSNTQDSMLFCPLRQVASFSTDDGNLVDEMLDRDNVTLFHKEFYECSLEYLEDVNGEFREKLKENHRQIEDNQKLLVNLFALRCTVACESNRLTTLTRHKWTNVWSYNRRLLKFATITNRRYERKVKIWTNIVQNITDEYYLHGDEEFISRDEKTPDPEDLWDDVNFSDEENITPIPGHWKTDRQKRNRCNSHTKSVQEPFATKLFPCSHFLMPISEKCCVNRDDIRRVKHWQKHLYKSYEFPTKRRWRKLILKKKEWKTYRCKARAIRRAISRIVDSTTLSDEEFEDVVEGIVKSDYAIFCAGQSISE